MKTKIFVLLFALALAAVRVYIGFAVTPEPITWVDVYKDIAHVFMGGLFVAWWNSKEWVNWKLSLFILMNVLEVSVAVISRV